MHQTDLIKREHLILRKKINFIDELIERFGKTRDKEKITKLLKDFELFWNNHEENEERIFGKWKDSKMIIAKHRSLRGHWKVIENYLRREDEELRIALHTDGKMLLNKFREHLEIEERQFGI